MRQARSLGVEQGASEYGVRLVDEDGGVIDVRDV